MSLLHGLRRSDCVLNTSTITLNVSVFLHSYIIPDTLPKTNLERKWEENLNKNDVTFLQEASVPAVALEQMAKNETKI